MLDITKEQFMKFANTTFVTECKKRNFDPVLRQAEKDKLVYVKTTNGIKTEIKLSRGKLIYITGFGRSQEELTVIAEQLTQNNREIDVRNRYILTAYVSIDDFFEFIKELEEIDEVVAKSRGWKKTASPAEIYTDMAKICQIAVTSGNTVLLDRWVFDKFDSHIAINQPSETRNYREHLVPCDLLLRRTVEMFQSGESVESVAQMLKDNLKIAYISEEDRMRIDFEYKLLTEMPSNWTWGDSVTARLDEASVIY